MENGAMTQSDIRSCTVCGASVTPDASSCDTCGAQLDASHPTGSRAPEEPTNLIRPSAAPESGPMFTAAGLPSRRPASSDLSEEDLFTAFTRSWEQTSPPQPTPESARYQPHTLTPNELSGPPRTPRIEDYFRSTTRARDESAATDRTDDSPVEPEPGRPVEPPQPPEPPQPVEPPKPAEPPPAPEPPVPFPPQPTPPQPTPPPVPPHPQPQPLPPTPDPVPPIPPGPPVPTPPPAPIPPIPQTRIGGTVATPGVYQGGTYTQLNTERVTALGPAVAAPRGSGTVYGRQSGGEPSVEMSGSLTGALLSRGQQQTERRVRRRARLRTALFATIGAVLFIAVIATVVAILAGDFIRSLYNTLAGIV
jgi:hypothetical protein